MLPGLVVVLATEWTMGVPWQVLAVQGLIYVMSRMLTAIDEHAFDWQIPVITP